MRYKNITLVVFILLSLSSCAKKEKGKVIAEIDGLEITKEEIEFQLPAGTKDDPSVFENFKKDYIKKAIFYKAAEEEGFLKREDIKTRLKIEKIKLVSESYLDNKLSPIAVSEDEVEKMFNEFKDYFNKDAELLILYYKDTTQSSMYKKVLKLRGWRLSRQIKALMKSNAVVGIDTIKSNLGELYLNLGKAFVKSVANLKIGEIAGPISMDGFYVYIKLLGATQVKYNPDEIKSLLRDYLLNKKKQSVEDSLYNYLLTKYSVREVTQ